MAIVLYSSFINTIIIIIIIMRKFEQQNMVINEDKVKKQCSKMPNWKAPRHDGVQGFWIKRLDSYPAACDPRRDGRNTILDDVWKNSAMSKGSSKGKLCGELQTNNLSSAYVEITYRYYFRGYVLFHGKQNLLPEEQKGCRRKSRGKKDQLLIDKTILKDCRKRRTNLAMAWIDYRKAYDFVPHSCIIVS